PAARTRRRPSWAAWRPARPASIAAGRSTWRSSPPSGSTGRGMPPRAGEVAGQIPLMWLLAGEIHRARRAAEDVLADERSSGSDRLSAELVLIPALNLLGQPVSALDRATSVLPRLADDEGV